MENTVHKDENRAFGIEVKEPACGLFDYYLSLYLCPILSEKDYQSIPFTAGKDY